MVQQLTCNCRACGNVFDYDKLKIVERKLYNISTQEKVCPVCESCQWEVLQQRRFLDRYLNFTNKEKN